MDIGASAKLELVDKFCYLHVGDMMSVDRNADAAVEARIRICWNKFRQLLPLLTHGMGMCCENMILYLKKCGGTSASRDENGQVDVCR